MSGLICESCKEEYSSYDEFMEYPIPNVTHLKRVLISKTENPTIVAQEVDETSVDFLLPGIFVAITSDTNEDRVLCDDHPHKKNKLCLNRVKPRFCNF